MHWIQQLLDTVKTLFEQVGFGPATLPLAFLLGLLSAFASACCTLPILGAVVGYSGTRKENKRGPLLLSALFFMLGTIIALMVLGSVAGFIGQAAQSSMGKYWKIFAGIIAILLFLSLLQAAIAAPIALKLEPASGPNPSFRQNAGVVEIHGGMPVLATPVRQTKKQKRPRRLERRPHPRRTRGTRHLRSHRQRDAPQFNSAQTRA